MLLGLSLGLEEGRGIFVLGNAVGVDEGRSFSVGEVLGTVLG